LHRYQSNELTMHVFVVRNLALIRKQKPLCKVENLYDLCVLNFLGNLMVK